MPDHVARGPGGRPAVPAALLPALADHYGLQDLQDVRDLGGSTSHNLLMRSDAGALVVRIHRAWLTTDRLAAMQDARRVLTQVGIPCAVPLRTRSGASWMTVGAYLVEVEPHVPSTGKMDTWNRLEAGLPILGRIHRCMRDLDVGWAARHAPASNSITPGNLVPGVRAGIARLRAWGPTAVEHQLTTLAETLALHVRVLEQRTSPLPLQLVHGDYWDNNVLFQHETVVLVADLDFMGARARIDDLALTLYYTQSTFADDRSSDTRLRQLRRLVDAYERGLDAPLAAEERRAIPLAMARTALGFVAMIADTESDTVGRQLAAELVPDLAWTQALIEDLPRWQQAMA